MQVFEFPKSLKQVKKAIADNQYTLSGLLEKYIENIKEHPDWNIFIEIFEEEAKQRAIEIEEKMVAGNAGKLAGMIISLKDNMAFKDHVFTASSKILENFTSVFSATVVERLLVEDAIIIGRVACDEFAMGSSSEKSYYGPVKNPLDPTKVPGGSSGGSTASVAGNMCLASLGSDTGGSIRQPASFCGLFGLKPTYGRVSRYGLIAYASSFDQIGPITHEVDDAMLLLELLSGPDDKDSTLHPEGKFLYQPNIKSDKKFTVAYPKIAVNHPSLDPEISDFIIHQIARIEAEGHQVFPYDFDLLEYLVPTYYVLSNAEASSNLSRYDGIHYGYRSENAKDIFSTYEYSRTEGFGTEVKRRIMLGNFVLSSGYYDAYYERAQKVRNKLRKETLAIFDKADLILMPTSPKTAFNIGEVKDPISMYLEDLFTVQANLCGFPAANVPVGKHSNGMPFGLQLMAAPFEEQKIADFSKIFFNI